MPLCRLDPIRLSFFPLIGFALLVSACSGSPEPGEASEAELRRAIEEGRALFESWDLKDADAMFSRAVDLARELKDARSEADSHFQRGRVRGSMRRYDEALEDFSRAEALYERLRDADNLARARAGQGAVYLFRGEIEMARARLGEAIVDASDEVASEILTRVSEVYFAEKNLREAELGGHAEAPGHANEAPKLSEGAERKKQQADSYFVLGEIAADDGDQSSAARYFEAAADAYRAIDLDDQAEEARREANRNRRALPASLGESIR